MSYISEETIKKISFLFQITLIADHGASLDLRDEKERTALFIAAAQGHTSIVKFLIERGANFNIEDVEGKFSWCSISYRTQMWCLD